MASIDTYPSHTVRPEPAASLAGSAIHISTGTFGIRDYSGAAAHADQQTIAEQRRDETSSKRSDDHMILNLPRAGAPRAIDGHNGDRAPDTRNIAAKVDAAVELQKAN